MHLSTNPFIMKKNTLLITTSIIAIALLIFSQVAWVQLMVKRDRERFEMELKQTLQSIVSFCLSREVSANREKLNFELIPIDPAQVPTDAIIRGSFDTKEYQSDKNLGSFLVGSFAENLLAENRISLEPMDSLFRKEFVAYSEIAAYSMRIQKNDSIMREMYRGEKAQKILSDPNSGVTVSIPLGGTGSYVHKTHVVFKPTVFTRRLRSTSLLSAAAIIVISLLVMYQLFRLKRKSEELASHKKAVNGLVHDLKSPLSYIYILMGTFERSEQDIDKKNRFLKSKMRVKHLSEKIEGLLLTLKNKDSALQLHPGTYPVTRRCYEIMDELRVVYDRKHILFTVEPSEETTITADPVYFDCCVRNLLDNAVKYSGDTPYVKVMIEKDNHQARLSIIDNGKGISPENKNRVFREFFRVENVSSAKNHGIGLAFTEQIVRAHSGKILLDSNVGKGSVFTLILPQ